MIARFIAICLLAACPPAAFAGVTAITIELLPQVKVRSAQVTLGQVAYLTSSDLPALRRLLAVPLGTAPVAGNTVSLDRATLTRWLRSQAGLRDGHIQWAGAQASAITTATRELGGHEIEQAAREALQSWLSERSQRAEVRALAVPRDLQLPEGAAELVVRPIDDTQPRKRMLVWVDVWAGGRFVRTLPVSFEVSAWAIVPASSSGAPAGAPLDVRALALSEVDVTLLPAAAIPAGALPAMASTGAQRLRRPVHPGEALTVRHLESVPAVERGQWLTARSVAGSVALESRVEALQDGRVGQTVRVKQANSANSISARVTGPGQVEVQP